MPKKNSYITVTDQFCGAGGSSQGVRMLSEEMNGGLEVKIALNHWKLAIETHNTNFPDTLHDCTDISACDPRRYFSTDILITSPECTTHSPGQGKKQERKQMELFNTGKIDPATERSRATMWDVPRFAEFHKYRIIITENVAEARKWVLFDAWIKAMIDLGYSYKILYLNSMHFFPTPQSRDRMYVIFWDKSLNTPNLNFTPWAYCEKCGCDIQSFQVFKNPAFIWGKFNKQYNFHCPVDGNIVQPYYYAAFNVIDWSDLGTRIGDRETPLVPNTERRIKWGLNEHGDDPLIITTGYSSGIECRVKKATNTLPTQPGDSRHGILTPFLVDDKQHDGIGSRVRSTKKAINTIHTDPRLKLITPFIIKTEYSNRAKSVNESLSTQTSRQTSAIITPFIVKTEHTKSSSKRHSKSVKNALHTQTKTQSVGIVTPMIIKNYGGTFDPKHASKKIDKPLGAITTSDSHALLTPLIIENKKQSKSRSTLEPLSSETTKLYQGLITDTSWKSFIDNCNSNTSRISDALRTQWTKEGAAIVNYTKPKYEDCFYRMLKPHEIKLGMAFEEDYIILGSGRDQVKQCGNAVTPPVMKWIIQQCIEVLK